MTKLQFLLALHHRLAALPHHEVEERLAFYSEMIEDRMEDGLTEEQAVASVGTVEEIARQIAEDIPLTKLTQATVRPERRRKGGEIALLIAGAPLWLPLLIAAAAVALSLYLSLWAVIVSLWACFGALIGCAAGGIGGSFPILLSGQLSSGLALIGMGLVCGGLAILWFFGCRAATKGAAWLTKRGVTAVKQSFIRKEAAQ